jgi:hypothetical protein
MSAFNIEKVTWSKPEVIQTRRGPKRLRKWPITGQAFWPEWRSGRLRALGYSISKYHGVWELNEWRDPDEPAEIRHTFKERTDDALHAPDFDPQLRPTIQSRFDVYSERVLELGREAGFDASFQPPHIKRLVAAADAHDGALDASDTGTGKTICALAAVASLGLSAFVICPKQIFPTWRKWANKLGCDLAGTINYEMLRTGNTPLGDWAVDDKGRRSKRYFKFDKTILDPERVALVFDEIHRMKDYKTLNCQLGLAAIAQGYKVLGLSATAADNPLQMKFVSLLTRLIGHERLFFGWMTSHGVRRGRFGMEFVGGRKELATIHRQIFPDHGSRIRIADLGDTFPQTEVIAEAYEMNGATAEIKAIYDEMHSEIAKLEATQEKDKGANILTVQLRARQRVELLKVPSFCHMAEDAMAEGMSVIVILNFEDSLQAVAKRLKTTSIIHGGQDDDHREQVRSMFDSDEENLIVMNIKAGGIGISLHGTSDSRPRLVLISPSFSGIDLKQALGRAWRAGGARSVQKIIFAAGTIEEDACDKVRARIGRIDTLNDGELTNALAF